jgi:anti-sigma factor RsiW
MNHTEAVEQMAAERYLLNELAPDARDAFEEHIFDCPECALDLRAGTLFVQEAKNQFPALAASQAKSEETKSSNKRSFSFFWWRPAFAVPALAALLILVGYQNFVTFPALRQSVTEPRLAPVVPLHSATRGATRPTFTVDRAHGLALPIDLSAEPGMASPASYSLSLRNPEGKLVWVSTLAAPASETESEQRFSLTIPGSALRNGTYSLLITSVSAQGVRTQFDQYNFDIVVTN